MCGICGILDRSGAPVDEAVLRRMNGAMDHRGPDGAGFFVEREIGLGHRRLSIIDLDGGAQPIGNEDDTLQLVFNGEIYNFVELRDELLALGHRFKTRSDTEVIVHAYEQWGEECVNRLNGMFAFALFDLRKRTLFLARDHLGVKPLYYAVAGRHFLFASEIKSLLQHPELRREMDLDSLAQVFTFRCVPAPRTLIEGVFKLQPGHSLTVTADSLEVKRFWHWIPRFQTRRGEGALVTDYQDLLEDVVRLQMRSDVPLGLFLSSGIDSGVLLSLMTQFTHRPVKAFTLGFEGGLGGNEVTDAARVAARYGAEHHALEIQPADYMAYFERYMWDIEEPVAHEAAPAFYMLSRLASSEVKVALAGQGADEPWAGYTRYLGVKLSSLYSRLPPALASRIANWVTRTPLPMERLKRGVNALAERDLVTRFTSVYSFFNPEMKQRLYGSVLSARVAATPGAPQDAIRQLQHDVRHLDPLSQMLYIDTRTNLPDDLLMVGDKTSMANSLEVRVPFLDRRLVEFIESLPPEMKLRGLTGKYLHKRALLKWLPRADVYRKKKGFANPIGHWLRTSMRPLVDDCLLSSNSTIARYFDQGYVRSIVERDRERKEQFTRHIFLLLSLELWHRAFISPRP